MALATTSCASISGIRVEQTPGQAVDWLSPESVVKLDMLQRIRESMEHRTQSSSRFFLMQDSPTVVVYLVAHSNNYTRQTAHELSSVFGRQYFTVSPIYLASLANDIAGNSVPQLTNDTHAFGALIPMLKEGGVLLGDALLLSVLCPEIQNLWILEEDLYFRNSKDLSQLVQQYKNDATDYLPAQLWAYARHHDCYWCNNLANFPKEEHHGSFLPVVRVSRRFVDILLTYTSEELKYAEPFFPTMAVHHNLSVKGLEEQYSCGLRWRPCWVREEMMDPKWIQCQFFHPVKWNDLTNEIQPCYAHGRRKNAPPPKPRPPRRRRQASTGG